MYEALDDYVAQKLPVKRIYDALADYDDIEIHGIYPTHFPEVAALVGWRDVVPVPFRPAPASKRLNFVRPAFFDGVHANGRQGLLVAVPPGQDYVRHYAGLIRHYASLHTQHAQDRMTIRRYPRAETALRTWTGIDHRVLRRGDSVIIGYVDEIHELLPKNTRSAVASEAENSFFHSRRLALADERVVNLLGVKFSFWGSIAAELARIACDAGVRELIYVGKLGALERPEDVYERIFCPSGFVTMRHRHIVEVVKPPPNGLTALFPGSDTGQHVSVPTVIEEDYLQRDIVAGLVATSIDNEVSQIAHAISSFNHCAGARVAFSPIHLATDYVRTKEERRLRLPLDMSNHRTRVARSKKVRMIERICDRYLFPYLFANTGRSLAGRRRTRSEGRP